jgi:ketosteroid isomerase-like protein
MRTIDLEGEAATLMTDDEIREAIMAIQDEQEIHRTLNQYSYCSDFNDAEGLIDCFTEDGEWWSAIGFTLKGKAEIREWVVNVRNPHNPFTSDPDQGRKGGQHYRTNIQIKLRGDQADVVSYLAQLAPDGLNISVMAMGRYIDRLVRCDDGRWRFSLHRTEVEAHDFDIHNPLVRREDSPKVRDDPFPQFS